jgi:hypothetical protein
LAATIDFPTPPSTISLMPLIPANLSDSAVPIRPPIRPEPHSMTNHWWIFGTLCTALLVATAFLAWTSGWFGFPGNRSRPFANARRQLRYWPKADSESSEYHQALQAVHRAFNETANETVFATNLERFFESRPQFAPLGGKSRIFFELSRQVFFTRSGKLDPARFPVRWLDELCRQFQRIE